MAGTKGRSGGARPNSGPKPKKPRKTKAKAYQTEDPDEFLRALMRDSRADFKDRMAAALALKKMGKGGAALPGKKEQQQQAARDIVQRDLSPSPAPSRPRLTVVGKVASK
jgi:hypothetical protein